MAKKQRDPVRVINVDKNGRQFEPDARIISRDEIPELFKLLEAKKHGN